MLVMKEVLPPTSRITGKVRGYNILHSLRYPKLGTILLFNIFMSNSQMDFKHGSLLFWRLIMHIYPAEFLLLLQLYELEFSLNLQNNAENYTYNWEVKLKGTGYLCSKVPPYLISSIILYII